MKKILLFITFIFSGMCFAQEATPLTANSQEDNTIYNASGVEKPAEFPGGIQEFYKYIGKNFIVPENKEFKGGKVYVSFVIEKDGRLADVKVLRDAGFGSGGEAIRVIKGSPNWIPAKQRDIPVRCQYMLPISLHSGN